jgi:hypothetical protein
MSVDRCALRLTRRYAATLDEVWDAVVAGRWLGTDAIAIHVVQPRRVVELELPDSVARIELRSDGDGTVLVLDHENILEPVGMRAMRNWTRALAHLEEDL